MCFFSLFLHTCREVSRGILWDQVCPRRLQSVYNIIHESLKFDSYFKKAAIIYWKFRWNNLRLMNMYFSILKFFYIFIVFDLFCAEQQLWISSLGVTSSYMRLCFFVRTYIKTKFYIQAVSPGSNRLWSADGNVKASVDWRLNHENSRCSVVHKGCTY